MKLVISILFSLILLTPLTIDLTGLDLGEFTNENRKLAKFPATPQSVTELPAYFKNLESYNNDNFSLRGLLIMTYNSFLYLFNESATKNIIIGGDKWIYNDYHYALSALSGKVSIDHSTVLKNLNIIKQNQEFFESKNIPFLFYLAPNKQSIYPEHIPKTFNSKIKNYLSDIYFSINTNQNIGINMVDMKSALLDYKGLNPTLQLYYSKDTHWNFTGSYVAYDRLIQEIKQFDPTIKGIDINKFKIKKYSKYFGLLERLGTFALFKDRGEEIELTTAQPLKVEWVSNSDKRIVAGRKNTVYTNNFVDNNKTILLIGDSFNGYLMNYFAESYHKVVVVFNNNGNWDTSILEQYPPDIVIFEVLERFLFNSLNQANLNLNR